MTQEKLQARSLISESWGIFKTNPWKLIAFVVALIVMGIVAEVILPQNDTYYVPESVALAYENETISLEEVVVAAEAVENNNPLELQAVVAPSDRSAVETTVRVLLYIVIILVTGVLSISGGLQFARRQKVTLSSLFKDVRLSTVLLYTAVVILFGLMVGIFYVLFSLTLLIGFFSAISVGSGSEVMMWGLAAVAIVVAIISIYLNLTFMYAPYAVIDKKTGIFGAFGESMRITKGNRWLLLRLYLLAFVIMLAGVLALIVGLLVALPVVFVAFALFYVKIVDNAQAQQEVGPIASENTKEVESVTEKAPLHMADTSNDEKIKEALADKQSL